MRVVRCIVAALLVVGGMALPVLADTLPAGYRIEPVARGLDNPQALAFAPDGRIFVGERLSGQVRVIKNGKLLAAPLLTLGVAQGSEEGLLGLATHPHFASNGYLYAYYTQSSPKTNRVVRYTIQGDSASAPFVILDDIGAASNGQDNGGGMAFDADGLLYVGVGAMELDGDAQAMNSLGGKILRIADDGSVPGDNPHIGEPYPYNLIFARGFRNTRGLAVHSGQGTLYAADNYDSDGSCDETNVVRAGDDYGWDTVSCSAGAYVGPLHAINPQIDVTGVASNAGNRYPGFTNDLFVGGRGGQGQILRDALSGDLFDTLSSSNAFYAPAEAVCPTTITAVAMGRDGWLYALSADADSAEAGLYRVVHDTATPREVSDGPHMALTMDKASGGGLDFLWEDLKDGAWRCTDGHCPTGAPAAMYALWQGDLAGSFNYNHAIVAETDGSDEGDAVVGHNLASMPDGNKYFLVSARNNMLEGSTGTDSAGAARPASTTDYCAAIGHGSTEGMCEDPWPHRYPNHNGEMVDITDYRGKIILLAFEAFE